MATQIKTTSADIPELVELLEETFPGVNLQPMLQSLNGVSLQGSLVATKTNKDGKLITIELDITPK